MTSFQHLDSVWYVVDAVNSTEKFHIKYPESCKAQQKIAEGFKQASSVDFDCCASAIDCILIWILRPTLANTKSVGVD